MWSCCLPGPLPSSPGRGEEEHKVRADSVLLAQGPRGSLGEALLGSVRAQTVEGTDQAGQGHMEKWKTFIPEEI